MTRRKPIPYFVGQCVDDALMSNTTALRALKDAIRNNSLTDPEILRRLAQAVDAIHSANQALQAAKSPERRD
jgi:hypothetical protein